MYVYTHTLYKIYIYKYKLAWYVLKSAVDPQQLATRNQQAHLQYDTFIFSAKNPALGGGAFGAQKHVKFCNVSLKFKASVTLKRVLALTLTKVI